ncbi:MAG: protein kinase [Terriglobus roseus]|nr:protein kinase [Terriglobus roseus]
MRNERNVLAAVAGHPFITTMIASFQDHDSLYMLLDYCPGGEVFSYLRRARRFNESTSQFYAAEIVLILEFLHEKEGVAYRDLKPENILIDAEGHLKLVDFGFAKRIYNSTSSARGHRACSNQPQGRHTLCAALRSTSRQRSSATPATAAR